jgi:cystathionine gamma-synthase
MRFETVLAQLDHYLDPVTGGLVPSIHPGVTHVIGALEPVADAGSGGVATGYARSGNSGALLIESLLARLDGGAAAAVFNAGIAAARSVLYSLAPGQHLLFDTQGYYEFGGMLDEFGSRWGVEVGYVDMCDPAAVREALRPGRTRLLWAECPSNPTWRVPNISALAALAHGVDARLLVDATVATPLMCRPLALGADLVLHSATKYLNGHGDLTAGVLVTRNTDDTWTRILDSRTSHGTVLPPLEAWLLLRGMRTLPLRFERASRSALGLAELLSKQPQVTSVYYPGLPDSAHHALARQQFSGGFGAMLSFEVVGGAEAALAVRDHARVFRRSTSLASTESLIEHRRSTEGERSNCPPALIRLSIGLEHPDDLAEDLLQALSCLQL